MKRLRSWLRWKLHPHGLPNEDDIAQRLASWKAITGRDLDIDTARRELG